MSEAIDTTIENAAAAEFVRPGSEQDVSKKGPIPKASDVRLDEINPGQLQFNIESGFILGNKVSGRINVVVLTRT